MTTTPCESATPAATAHLIPSSKEGGGSEFRLELVILEGGSKLKLEL